MRDACSLLSSLSMFLPPDHPVLTLAVALGCQVVIQAYWRNCPALPGCPSTGLFSCVQGIRLWPQGWLCARLGMGPLSSGRHSSAHPTSRSPCNMACDLTQAP